MTVWFTRLLLPVVLAALLLPPSPSASAAAPDVDGAAVDEFVAEQLERSGAPGAAYAVVGPDGVLLDGTLGTDGNGEPVTDRTPFLWGSVSKPVTATLVVLLAQDGVLDLDAPVADRLPAFSERLTVRQLLAHTSGIPGGLQLTDVYDGDRSLDHVVGRIAELTPLAAPGEEHTYSSLNYVVLAAVVEEATGADFGTVLEDRLLGPAGMDGVPADPAEAERGLPPGHRYVFGSARAFESRVDPATRAAGYLVGGLADAAAFARLQLRAGGLLDQEALGLLHGVEVETGEESGYGLGWRTWQVPGGDEPMIWHGGAAPGYQSVIALLPEQELAVVVLQNVYGPFQENMLLDAGWGIASLLAGAEPQEQDTDPGYLLVLAVLGTVVVGLLALLARCAVRWRRPAPDARPRARRALVAGAWVLGLGATAAVLLALPGLVGVGLRQLPLWAPDAAWLLYAGLALVPVLAAARLAVLAQHRRA